MQGWSGIPIPDQGSVSSKNLGFGKNTMQMHKCKGVLGSEYWTRGWVVGSAIRLLNFFWNPPKIPHFGLKMLAFLFYSLYNMLKGINFTVPWL